eukprot:TRINITY_DN499_c0_g1_i1.p1 TRINITY_DN499_c0_g1~~TRINITY_DN499_c0_g1_i1.p1  ORF type:complete len:433 (+),score=61.57 TRINITY_DN499_c0_g1_i1:32-1330(+)
MTTEEDQISTLLTTSESLHTLFQDDTLYQAFYTQLPLYSHLLSSTVIADFFTDMFKSADRDRRICAKVANVLIKSSSLDVVDLMVEFGRLDGLNQVLRLGCDDVNVLYSYSRVVLMLVKMKTHKVFEYICESDFILLLFRNLNSPHIVRILKNLVDMETTFVSNGLDVYKGMITDRYINQIKAILNSDEDNLVELLLNFLVELDENPHMRNRISENDSFLNFVFESASNQRIPFFCDFVLPIFTELNRDYLNEYIIQNRENIHNKLSSDNTKECLVGVELLNALLKYEFVEEYMNFLEDIITLVKSRPRSSIIHSTVAISINYLIESNIVDDFKIHLLPLLEEADKNAEYYIHFRAWKNKFKGKQEKTFDEYSYVKLESLKTQESENNNNVRSARVFIKGATMLFMVTISVYMIVDAFFVTKRVMDSREYVN